MKRRANREGTIYREGQYWVAEATWSDDTGTHRRRRRRKTQSAAREALVRLHAEIRGGAIATGDRTKLTVADVMERYLQEAASRVSERTLRDYAAVSRRRIVPALGKLRAHALRRTDVVRMLDAVQGARSRQLAYVVAKAALDVHVRHVDPVEHPFPPRATPSVARREHQPWSPSQLAIFLAAIRGDRLEALYILALGTGLRQSEVLGLHWTDVSDRAVIVRGKLDEHSRTVAATKTARSRRGVDIPPVVAAALEAHRSRMRDERRSVSGTAFVFVNEAGRPIVASNLRRAWRALRARLDLPPIRFYDLRHAHATALAVAGVHPAAVSARLGHASTRLTLDTYSHVMPAMSDAAVRASAALFDKPVPPKTPPKPLKHKAPK